MFPVCVEPLQSYLVTLILFITFINIISRPSQGAEGFMFSRALDCIAVCCGWCGSVGLIELEPSAGTGLVCSQVWSRWNDDQHLQVWYHMWKKVNCQFLVRNEVLSQVEEFKVFTFLFTSESRMDQEINWKMETLSAVVMLKGKTLNFLINLPSNPHPGSRLMATD